MTTAPDLSALVPDLQRELVRSSDTPRAAGHFLHAQGIELDLRSRVVFRDGEPLPRLPQKEFLILRFLLERAGQVVEREELMEGVWGEVMTDAAAKTLDVHVKRLRGRLERDRHHPVLIRTLRGVGYIFDTTPIPTDVSHANHGI